MEPESVLIVAYVFIFLNVGIIACIELTRDPKSDSNIHRDVFSRIINPLCIAVSLCAMIGAQKRKPLLLLPFMITLVLFMASLVVLAVYLVTWCPFQASNADNILCSIGIVLGATCMGGMLFGTCLSYIVLSLYKFLREEHAEKMNNTTEIELLDVHNETAQPSTSYN